MTNLFNSAARSIVGVAGALFLSFAFLTVSVGPALSTAPVSTQSA